MLRCLETMPGAEINETNVVDKVTLDLDARRKRRQTLLCDGGLQVLIDLPAVPTLRDGDGFRLEDGRIIRIKAAPEALLEVRSSATDLGRIAWHLGNRHLPVQFIGEGIRLRADHVIEDMLEKLGADTRRIEAPFDPEGGAYGYGHTHAHD